MPTDGIALDLTYHDRRISGSMAPALGAMFAICDASEFYGYCASAVSEGIDVNPNKIRRLCASMICSKDVARFGQPSESGEADHTGRSGPALGFLHASRAADLLRLRRRAPRCLVALDCRLRA